MRAATAGWVRKCCSCKRIFCSTNACTFSAPARSGCVASTTLRAASALRSQEVTVGMRRSVGSSTASRPFMAPQSEWPQTTMWVTPRAMQAYSTMADTPPSISP